MQTANQKDNSPLDDASKAKSAFQISFNQLIELVKAYKSRTFDEEITAIENQEGTEGISNKLKVDVSKGISGDSFPDRTAFFGNNYRPPKIAKTFCKIFFETLDDFMLKVLLVAATLSLVCEYIAADEDHYSTAWFDGAAIYLAVLIVSGFSSLVDWRKEREFVGRQQEEEDSMFVTVTRPNERGEAEDKDIHINYLHVGDIMHLKYGMEIPVDGVVLQCNQLTTNEAAMTGESDERRKETFETCRARQQEKYAEGFDKTNVDKAEAHGLPSPLILSGTAVASGEGRMLVVMVGDFSAYGEILKKLTVEQEDTPLQQKLEIIGTEIGKIGTYAALVTIHVLLFRYFLDGILKRNIDLFGGEDPDADFAKSFQIWVNYFVIGVAVIVVAVPEGLPLAVMISLAYSQGKMLQDNNYVKELKACEIMGGATNICSDKTGTLTLNQMHVEHVWVGKDVELPVEQDEEKKIKPISVGDYFSAAHWAMLEQQIACNIPKDLSATDKAMSDLLERGGTDISTIQKKHGTVPGTVFIRFPFSSNRKRMSTVISDAHQDNAYGKRLVIKGASEMILKCCKYYTNEQGQVVPLDDNSVAQIKTIIDTYAKLALRTIALAYRDLDANTGGTNHNDPEDQDVKDVETNDLTLVCILGIYDVIRTEVPQAVLDCQNAGVRVRMITGDNIVTAQAIAEKCGIIAKDEMGDPEVCMGGPEFYEMMGGLIEKDGKERVKNMGAFKKIAPKLKVMARSRPEDKYLLVTGLMNMNQVVAVTGDGTNDAMALSKADVGFGMGKTGTAVCKKAADIIIVDDSFTSVVKACSWGRNIYDNIKAFLQFQLTVNVNALIFTVIGAVLLKESPLQAIQLLWVNMIMDSLASLALATELPKPELLLRPPQVKDDFVVSRKMTKHILYMSLFQMVILFIFLFGGEYMIPEPDVELRFNQFYPIVDMDIKDSEMVFPGRLYKVNGDPLYKIVQEANNDDSSRHMTFIFNLFIWLQIINMIAARKIHDEKNLCKGFFDNPMFLIIWVLIVAVNFLIIQYTGPFFSLHPKGLSWEQHVLCIGVSFSVLLCNLLLKCLPDDVAPLLGKDSVDAVRVAMREDARRNGGQA